MVAIVFVPFEGFAFLYMADDRDAEDAIDGLDGMEFGRRRRKLCVQWAKGDGYVKRREETRRDEIRGRPSKTLFVVNFDPSRIDERDIERHFDVYGRVERVQIRKNFAFVQFEDIEDAIVALEKTNNSTLGRNVITVEYATKRDEAAEKGDGWARSKSSRFIEDEKRLPGEVYSRSPPRERRYRSRSNSRSPAARGRSPSPPPRRRGSRSPSPRRRPSP